MISIMSAFGTSSESDGALALDKQSIFYRCVEDSNDAIMISDRKGQLVYVNPAWQRIYGYTEEEAMGQTPRLLHSGVHDPVFYRQMWSKISDPGVGFWKGELVNRSKSGVLIPVLLTITPFNSPDGQPLGYMGIAVDISWRKELEAKAKHQDRLATIGTLVSGLAHEVGTPLGVIRGRAEFLQMQTDNGVIRRSVEVILGQTDRISKIIQSLLKLSRGSEDQAKLAPVKLAELCEEVLSLLSGPMRAAQVQWQVEVDPSIEVQADATRMEHILLNLIVNAVHAIEKRAEEGGAFERKILLKAVPCSSCEPGLWIELQLADTGCGIREENLARVFEPFFTTKEVGQGTGLGLPISLKMMQEMGASLDVTSEWGVGTTFYLRFKRVGSK
jgi:two-component system cell cycle sensor histidine kinase/response regulator CckA